MEGDSGTTTSYATVTTATVSSTDITVYYTFNDGTASSADGDFNGSTVATTISAGSASTQIPVYVSGDTKLEDDETFTLRLTGASGATVPVSGRDGTVTISNDDTVNIFVSDVTPAEGNGTVDVNVELSAVAETDVVFNYATADGTASAGSEYTAASGSATISSGSISTLVTVAIADNSTDDAWSTFYLDITSSDATVTDGRGDVTIIDDDGTITIDDVTVNEGAGTATLTVTLTGPVLSDVYVDYATSNGTATAGNDFTSVSGNITLAAPALSSPYQSTATIPITITDDSISEGSESFTVNLSNITGGSAAFSDNSGSVDITDNDGTPTIDFNATSSSGAESSSSAALQVDLSGTSPSNVTVNYAVTGTASGSGTDYTLADGTLTITAGNTTGTITIASIVDDAITEGNETVIVTLSSPSGATLGSDDAHTYTITAVSYTHLTLPTILRV